jgi:hypothetical protein
MSCDDSDTLVELWIALAIFAHFLGIVTFFFRAEVRVSETEGQRRFRRARHWIGFRREGRLCVNQGRLEFTWGEENWNFFVCSWLAAVYTVAYLTFRTAVLSSLSLVSKHPQSSTFPRAHVNNSLIIL